MGRTCYYAGAPAQVEILAGSGVTDQYKPSMLPVGLSGSTEKYSKTVIKFSRASFSGTTC